MNTKNNLIPYLPAEMEIINFDKNDIVVTSYTADNNEDDEW